MSLQLHASCSLRLAVPPATAERLEQRRRVGVTRRLRGDEIEALQLKLLLGDEQREDAGAAELVLALRQLQRLARERGRIRLRLERARIRLQRSQRVGDILKRH